MKATDLRLGNLVAPFQEPDRPDHVILLEPCLVHLLGDTAPREEHDVTGVPLDARQLHRCGIPHREWFLLGRHRVYISVIHPRSHVQVHVDRHLFRVSQVHELQNLLFDLTGEHILTHPHIHHPYEAVPSQGHD